MAQASTRQNWNRHNQKSSRREFSFLKKSNFDPHFENYEIFVLEIFQKTHIPNVVTK